MVDAQFASGLMQVLWGNLVIPTMHLLTFKKSTVVHVGREKNIRADELANLALDRAKSALNDAENELAKRIVGVFGEKPIDSSRCRLVLDEVGRLLKDK